MLRYEDVAEVLRVIESSSCEELVLDTADFKIVVRRRTAEATAIGRTEDKGPQPAPVARLDNSSASLMSAVPSRASTKSVVDAAAGLKAIRAPMVGTFFRASGPGKPPFVEVGSVVEKGDQVCLIEVMKLFTSIFAEESGRIAQICVKDSELVEFGQPLFVFEPA